MTSTKNIECGYTVFSDGDKSWIRNVSIPLAEALEQIATDDNSISLRDELPEYLDVDSRTTADGAILIGGVVGVFAFFASWLATKILDDVYEAKFQPAIKNALKSANAKLQGANATEPKMLQLGISYADKRVFILIGIVADTFDEILHSEHMIKSVHANAVDWIKNNDLQHAIHLYIINRGNVNLEPELFENLELAHLHIRKLDFRRSET